ncbi:hypothetical protein B0H17DRAFT_927003 [Mycena rosella]|uniref:NAD(P)-binding protein n=1 Tax=Mycena rosella TaxID=1033263 RepID=A0AAD7DU74_MYCRO|nr:hypothetical protein B0H17DRAFT_927003 [Mycena rosella]
MKFSFWDFIKVQFAVQTPVATADLTGKTVLVLGANTGIGFQAATHFAKMNAERLILACRSESKGQAALNKLKAETGYERAELWLVDLADFSSVQRFADKFERDGGRLDILVENAAIGVFAYETTKDGWESNLQVNSLAGPLLALLLLPIMVNTANQHATTPRIVVVTSGVHYWHTFEKSLCEDPAVLKTLGSKEYCTPQKMGDRYPLTKLLNVFFVRALNARLAPATPLIVNAVCPGYCYSELRRHWSGVLALMDHLMELVLALTPEQGSRQLVWGAVAHEAHPEALCGAYISSAHVVEASDFVLSAQGAKVQDRVWDNMVEILGKIDPRVTVNVEKYLSYNVGLP